MCFSATRLCYTKNPADSLSDAKQERNDPDIGSQTEIKRQLWCLNLLLACQINIALSTYFITSKRRKHLPHPCECHCDSGKGGDMEQPWSKVTAPLQFFDGSCFFLHVLPYQSLGFPCHSRSSSGWKALQCRATQRQTFL